ncbi:sensor histidine kinase [Paraflavitalea pollutisoli]|uniref:sensor histidine kinase n=1 Tax=Paraflavitalea pollutisoli TaxID=3034143 RepID=UPI0023EB9307|nr:histidine kinase [Paraflavitalea sp. H1-2-19X]
MTKPAGKGINILWAQVFSWTFLALIIFLLFFHEGVTIVQSIVRTICYTCFFAMIVYINTLVLVPHVYRRRSKWLYVLLVVVLLVAVTWSYIGVDLLLEWYVFRTEDKPMKVPPLRVYMGLFFLNTIIYLFSLPVRLAFDYVVMRGQQEQLQRRTAEAELNLLKAQVQPHFLFNTLNNIYFVAQRESPNTAMLLERLSNIMRYFVDEGPKERIPLTREIDFINDYIHLEKLRMRHPMQTDFQISGEVNQVTIPPMLLIPLVENVFKHGVNKRSESNTLAMKMVLDQVQLELTVVNPLFEDQEPLQRDGNGLTNLQNRLQLLYGQNFTLRTEKKDGQFIAYLKIPLS